MPRAAWVEIRDASGEMLVSIPAEISGGGIFADLPAFPPGTLGTVQLCTEGDDGIVRDAAELEELPTQPLMMGVQIG